MPEIFLAALPALFETAGAAELGAAGLGAEGIAAGSGLGAGIATDLATGITSDLLASGGISGLAAGSGLGAGITTDLATGLTSDIAPVFGSSVGSGASALPGAASSFAGGAADALPAAANLPDIFSTGGDVLVGGTPGGVTGAGASPLTTGIGSAVQPVSFSGASTGAAPAAGAPAAPAGTSLSSTATGLDLSSGASDPAAVGGSFGGGGDTAATGSSSGGGITGGFDKFLDKNLGINTRDLGLATSIGGLGMNLLNRNQPIPGESQLKNAAGSLSATAAAQGNQGAHLESFINSGTLPPGLEQGLRSATEAAKATVRSSYAARGMSGSSSEAQDLQAAEDRAVAAGQAVALQLLQQGASMVGQAANTEGMAAQLYSEIMRDALSRDAQLGSAIGNFASALAGGHAGGGNTITVKAA